MSGKRSRDKGSRFERALTATLIAHGIPAKRVPLSGAAEGFKGDVIAEIAGLECVLECKARGKGFKQFYEWIDGNWAVVCKADRMEPLVVQRLSDWLQLAAPQEPERQEAAE